LASERRVPSGVQSRRRFSLSYQLTEMYCFQLLRRPPLSMNAFGFWGSSFPFSSLACTSAAAHKILAVFIKKRFFPSPQVFDSPTKPVRHMALPIRLFGAGPGKTSPLISRCLSGLRSSTSRRISLGHGCNAICWLYKSESRLLK
jgi:hypothetical protein